MNTVDYADSRWVDLWLRHPVYGDPSFDSFEHVAGNPVFRGSPPLEWPVNGFFFQDPLSANWYLYIGDYPTGYWNPRAPGGNVPARCIVLRSSDQGAHWEKLGAVLPEDPSLFDGDGKAAGLMPDVSVVYDAGRYHMVYDWATPKLDDFGIAYAWSERPEGPFHRAPQPIQRRSAQPLLLGRYNRPYAATILRRKHDWMILAMMDAPPFSWAMYGMTAPAPEGPYTAPALLRHVEAGYYHPPLLEFFPAFQYDGWVYAPATSVALNRDFQVIFRAPQEQALKPDAWQIFRHGSAWHSEDLENEHAGIWGQTFSGWVDARGVLHAMFPSRDPQNRGTINLAERPWAQPLRPRGFRLAGHAGPAITCLRRSFGAFRMHAAFRLHGAARIFWGFTAPIGPNRPASDSTLGQVACRASVTGLGHGSCTRRVGCDR
jgi:hypothetical protein